MKPAKPRRRSIIILYGLPGSGKTTLARYIAETRPSLFFADVANHDKFNEQALHRSATDLYAKGGRGLHFITDGVLKTPEIRNRFARNVYNTLSADRYLFSEPRLVFVNELSAVMSERRLRTVEKYNEMKAEYLVGSGKYPHAVLDGATLTTLEARADWLMQSLSKMVVDKPLVPCYASDLSPPD